MDAVEIKNMYFELIRSMLTKEGDEDSKLSEEILKILVESPSFVEGMRELYKSFQNHIIPIPFMDLISSFSELENVVL